MKTHLKTIQEINSLKNLFKSTNAYYDLESINKILIEIENSGNKGIPLTFSDTINILEIYNICQYSKDFNDIIIKNNYENFTLYDANKDLYLYFNGKNPLLLNFEKSKETHTNYQCIEVNEKSFQIGGTIFDRTINLDQCI